jgi:hypothetical protein
MLEKRQMYFRAIVYITPPAQLALPTDVARDSWVTIQSQSHTSELSFHGRGGSQHQNQFVSTSPPRNDLPSQPPRRHPLEVTDRPQSQGTTNLPILYNLRSYNSISHPKSLRLSPSNSSIEPDHPPPPPCRRRSQVIKTTHAIRAIETGSPNLRQSSTAGSRVGSNQQCLGGEDWHSEEKEEEVKDACNIDKAQRRRA